MLQTQALWDYESPFVKDRLDKSIQFIRRFVPPDFSGSFFEPGAFNGQFTYLLAGSFASATIHASDISEDSIASARANVGHPNVQFSCADIASLQPPRGSPEPRILLLLECIYYMPEPERREALKHLVTVLDRPDVFISFPITGGKYPTEQWIMKQMRRLRYRRDGLLVLNYSDEFRRKVETQLYETVTKILPERYLIHRNNICISLQDFFIKGLHWSAHHRRKYARQVIYRFVPA